MNTEQQNATWATLPDEIRDLLNSDETSTKIEAIAARQGANEMEQLFLVRICANLMKGTLQPADFVNTIATELDLSRDKAAYIAQEVNRDIFSGIKEALKTVHTKGGQMQIDPKLVTCLPEDSGKDAIPSGNVARPEPAGSILEQKLGGTFRIQSQVAKTTGVPDPMLVTPPPPQRTTPPPQAAAAPAVDPYRELPA